MIKKLTLLAMAIGALVAFAVPAMAGAAELTDEKGNPIEVGTTISATSDNVVFHIINGGDLTCSHMKLNGIVTSNSSGTASLAMDDANDTANDCMISGVPTAVDPTFTHLHLNGTSGTIVFDLLINGLCPESSGASIVTWTTGTDVLSVEAAVNGPVPCPDGVLTGDFTLTDHESNPIIVD